jgi:hypothetical protein
MSPIFGMALFWSFCVLAIAEIVLNRKTSINLVGHYPGLKSPEPVLDAVWESTLGNLNNLNPPSNKRDGFIDWSEDTIYLGDFIWKDVVLRIDQSEFCSPSTLKEYRELYIEDYLVKLMRKDPDDPINYDRCFDFVIRHFDKIAEGDVGRPTEGEFRRAWTRACSAIRADLPDTPWGRVGAPRQRGPEPKPKG